MPASHSSLAPLRVVAPRRSAAGIDARIETHATALGDARLDPDLRMLTESFAAGAERADRAAAFGFDNLAALHAYGLIGAVVPCAAGGGGATLAHARRIVSAVARGDPSTALVLTMSYLVHGTLAAAESRWPAHLRDAVWQSAIDQGALANNLRVEPELGSPARGGMPGTIARRSADGWRLSGHKLYTTGIPALRWLLVWARTDEAEPRVGVFLVPRDPAAAAPGIRVIESWDHLGLRASASHEVVFDDVALPTDHAVDIRPPADWAGGPEPTQHAWMITLLGALYDGIARAARTWLVGFLAERRPAGLGAALSTVPRVQQTVGEIDALLWANDTLLTDLARRSDEGAPPDAAASGLVKYSVTGNAIRAVDLALQLTGNHGLSRHNPLERHWRDVLCSRIHTPQNDSILEASGRSAFASPVR
jgi:alkylation response protein AidB-like acyl-CoA dehydrogenase